MGLSISRQPLPWNRLQSHGLCPAFLPGADLLGDERHWDSDSERHKRGRRLWPKRLDLGEGGSNVADQQGTYGTQGMAAAGNAPGGHNGLVGPTRPGISGSSAGMVTIRRGSRTSTTYGSTARANGRGWAARTGGQKGTYGTQGTAAAATFPGREMSLLLGPIRPEISGSSVGMVTTQRGQAHPQRPVEVQRGRMDVDGRVERGQPGDVRDSGDSCCGQRSWGATKPVVGPMRPEISGSSVGWLRLNGDRRRTQRPVEVQRGRMDVDGRIERGQPEGNYGTQGTAAAGNVPGARHDAVTWTDASGNFWLFGGNGYDSRRGRDGDTSTTCGSTARANGRGWAGRTWPTSRGRTGPRGRLPPATFLGRERLLLVGPMRQEISGSSVGMVIDSAGTEVDDLNDLWKYSGGEWTWMGGSNVANLQGTYGTEGAAAASNVPGARDGAVVWTDAAGNLWLLGGNGYYSLGTATDISTTCGSTSPRCPK